jgi:hypothetical protein
VFTLSVFMFIGFTSLVLLVALVIFDGIFDLFGGEPVLPALALTGAIFGLGGALARNITGEALGGLIMIPGTAALAIGVAFFFAYRALKRHADKDEVHQENPLELLGAPAKVNWWSGETGEVIVDYVGQPRRFRAVAEDETFSAQLPIHIIDVLEDNSVRVSN